MSSTDAIATKIQEVERRRQQAADAERERLARENQFQREQAQAEAELQELHKAAAGAQFSDRLGENDAIVSQQKMTIAELHNTLDALLPAVKACLPNVTRVDETFQRQQAKHEEALTAANDVIRTLPAMPASPADMVRGLDASHSTVMRNSGVLRQHEQQITPALDVPSAMILWIQRAQDEQDRICRLGIAYALTMKLFNVAPGQNVSADQLREDMKQRVSRLGKMF